MRNTGLFPDALQEETQSSWKHRQATAREASLLAKFLPDNNGEVELLVSHKTVPAVRVGHSQPLLYSTANHKAKYGKKSCFANVPHKGFGEIQYFSYHNETYAMLHFFPPAEVDGELNMYFCRREKAGEDFVRLSNMSKPLFVAFAGENTYFLSA